METAEQIADGFDEWWAEKMAHFANHIGAPGDQVLARNLARSAWIESHLVALRAELAGRIESIRLADPPVTSIGPDGIGGAFSTDMYAKDL